MRTGTDIGRRSEKLSNIEFYSASYAVGRRPMSSRCVIPVPAWHLQGSQSFQVVQLAPPAPSHLWRVPECSRSAFQGSLHFAGHPLMQCPA
jgi:hypothetical protein